jgi:hypothetical protein
MLTEQTPATRFELSHRSAQIDQVCGPQPASAAKPLAAPSVRSVMRLVDTPDSIPQFVDQVADQIRQWSASIDGFSAGEFVAALGDVVIAEAEQETSYSTALTVPHFTGNPALQWTKDYVKHCSSRCRDLEQWASNAVSGEVIPCTTCLD